MTTSISHRGKPSQLHNCHPWERFFAFVQTILLDEHKLFQIFRILTPIIKCYFKALNQGQYISALFMHQYVGENYVCLCMLCAYMLLSGFLYNTVIDTINSNGLSK